MKNKRLKKSIKKMKKRINNTQENLMSLIYAMILILFLHVVTTLSEKLTNDRKESLYIAICSYVLYYLILKYGGF